MLKTIKTTKQMRLDELINHVWENMNDLFKSYGIITFYSKNGKEVAFNSDGMLQVKSLIDVLDYFEIEVEEEITEDTEFYLLVELYCRNEKYWSLNYMNSSVNNVKDDTTISIHALINGKLELIWEREDQ